MLKGVLKNDFLIKIIDEMVKIDQSARKNALDNSAQHHIFYNHIVYLVDSVNGQRIKDIIKKYGHPTKKMISEQSMKNFWLLIQHQDFNPDLQKTCLEKCDFDSRNKAYLTDRVLINSGEKQLYGTQFHRNEKGEMKPQPIEDEINADKRRKEVGLEPLADYAIQMQKKADETKS